MLWADPMIRTNFSVQDLRNGGIALDRKAEKSIWQPDVYLSNLSNHKQYVESRQTKSIKLLSENMTDEIYLQNMAPNQTSATHVRWTIEAKATFYCTFKFSEYTFIDTDGDELSDFEEISNSQMRTDY